MGKKTNDKYFTTVEVCQMFDVSRDTLFRWEKEGLISPIGRDWRNWRIYSEKHLAQITKMMKKLKKP